MRSGSAARALRNMRTGIILARHVRLADTPGARELRLLARDVVQGDDGLWLDPCTAVNTFGMRSAIDVVFLDSSNRIVAMHLRVTPNQHEIRCARARSAVQLGASPNGTCGRVTSLRSTSAIRRWAIPGIVLAALAGAHAAGAVLVPPTDGDLGWQHWLGTRILSGGLPHSLGIESFAAAGARWVPQEWLFSTLLALASSHGLAWLFAMSVGTCAVVALALVAVRCARYGAHPMAVAVVLVCTDAAMSQSFGVRVQVVGWALLAAFLVALELPVRFRWTAVAVAVAWANVHASAAAAPALAAAAAAGSLLQGDRRGALRDGALALCCAGAICVTPLGAKLPFYAIELAHSPIRHWIREWRPTTLTDGAFAFGALPLFALAAAAARRAPRRAVALVLPLCYLAFGAVRSVPLAAIACAPLAALALTGFLPSLAALRNLPSRVAAVAAAVAFCLAAGAAALAARGVHDERPLAAIDRLAQMRGQHRLLCENFAWCGPAVDTGRISVFVDGRADPFPRSIWMQYDAVVHIRRGWRLTLRRYGVNAMLVQRGGALDRAAEGDGWRIAYDAPIRLLVPRSSHTEPESGS